MKLPRISVRHRGAIYFLVGIGLGLAAVFLVVKDKFTYLDANDTVRKEQAEATKQQNNSSKDNKNKTYEQKAAKQ